MTTIIRILGEHHCYFVNSSMQHKCPLRNPQNYCEHNLVEATQMNFKGIYVTQARDQYAIYMHSIKRPV